MDSAILMDWVGQVGFPIVVAGFLLIKVDKTMVKLTNSIDKLIEKGVR